MSDFKNFKTKQFDRVKIKGMFEKNLEPAELIVNAAFSIVPTQDALDRVDTEGFQEKLKEQLSLFAVDRLFRGRAFEGWEYDGSRYTYGHDYSQVKLKEQVSSLGLDFYFIRTDKTRNIEEFFEEASKLISELGCFGSNDLFEVRPGRKHASGE